MFGEANEDWGGVESLDSDMEQAVTATRGAIEKSVVRVCGRGAIESPRTVTQVFARQDVRFAYIALKCAHKYKVQ
jgi:hypothetical protein